MNAMEILIPVIIVAVIGIIAGVGLSLASKFFSEKTPEKLLKIQEALPGANCGSCGFSGCQGYAEAIFKGEAEPNRCTVGGAKTAKELSEILGADIDVKSLKAFVKCNGSCNNVQTKFAYDGMQSCSAAVKFYGGPSACEFGCMGFGDCEKACEFDAIKVVDGVAKVDKSKCTGCGKCASVCPKKVIDMLPENYVYAVACSNKSKGPVAMKVCAVSCIGCTKCAKVCESGAVTIENFLAEIDADKCIGCGKCAENCVRKCIVPVPVKEEPPVKETTAEDKKTEA